MSRHCFYWIHLSLVIDLLFGGKWVFIHNPCGFFFKRDQGLPEVLTNTEGCGSWFVKTASVRVNFEFYQSHK